MLILPGKQIEPANGILLGGMEGAGIMAPGEFRFLHFDHKTNRILNPDEPFKHNVVIDNGRKQVAKYVLNITTPAPPINYGFMAVGSSTTATDPTQTGPIAELTADANRPALLNSSNASFSDTDIVADLSVSPYRWKVIAQATYLDTDANNGSTFAEWSLCNQAAFGAGSVFYNRYMDGTTFVKTGALTLLAQMILRF